tara:strand:- start:176 stop:385 length:210 start_codon:yes stop_codon:yes gene_type:complete
MNNIKRQKLIKELQRQVADLRKFQEDFKKNIPDSDNMNLRDLQYMNGIMEKMKLEHETVLREYYNFKES